MNHNVWEAIEQFHLIQQGDRVCAALSGGADSVALTHFLWENQKKLGIQLSACHVNHCLRGEESLRDQKFVESFCRELEIPLEVRVVDVAALSRQDGFSQEECGRRERYRLFGELGKQGWLVATAHTQSDSVETVLFNLCRGTGLKGLTGIPSKRDGIIRPLILCTRREIEAYCQEKGLSYVTDSTNLTDGYSRNRLRLRVLPELEKVHPGAGEAIARLSRTLLEEEDFLKETAKRELERIRIPGGLCRKEFLSLHRAVQRRVLALWLGENRIPVTGIRLEQLLGQAKAGEGQVDLTGPHIFAASPAQLAILDNCKEEADSAKEIKRENLPGFRLKSSIDGQMYAVYSLDCEQIENFIQKKDSCLKNILDYDKIYNTVLIRHRQPGDCIRLAGRGCQKTLKKLFNEQKIPSWQRQKIWILSDEEGILWMEGFGVAQRAAVSEKTVRAIWVKREEDGQND